MFFGILILLPLGASKKNRARIIGKQLISSVSDMTGQAVEISCGSASWFLVVVWDGWIGFPSLKFISKTFLKIGPTCPKRKCIIFQSHFGIFKGKLGLKLPGFFLNFSKLQRLKTGDFFQDIR